MKLMNLTKGLTYTQSLKKSKQHYPERSLTGAARNCGIQIEALIHWQCCTNGSLGVNGGRDARDLRNQHKQANK
jgi:hypothetical protein